MNTWFTDNNSSFSSFYKYYPEHNNTLIRIRLATDRARTDNPFDNGDPSIFVTPKTLVYSSPDVRLHNYYSFNGYFEFDLNRNVRVCSNSSGYYGDIVVRNITNGDYMFDLKESMILNRKCSVINIHHGHIIRMMPNSLPPNVDETMLEELADKALLETQLEGLDYITNNDDKIFRFTGILNENTLSEKIREALLWQQMPRI